jgi:hypothetical protein
MEATKIQAAYSIDDDKVQQLHGKPGADYGAWIRSDHGQHIWVQIGQCDDAPEGDARARRIVLAMVHGLNANQP